MSKIRKNVASFLIAAVVLISLLGLLESFQLTNMNTLGTWQVPIIIFNSSSNTTCTNCTLEPFQERLGTLATAANATDVTASNDSSLFDFPCTNCSLGPFPERFGTPAIAAINTTCTNCTLGPFSERLGTLATAANATVNASNDSSMFDYQAFWDNALEIALANNKSLVQKMEAHSHSTAPCPKVYIYSNVTPSLRDDPEVSLSLDSAFGKAVGMQGHLRKTMQWGFAKILEYRLRNSKSCLTHDPQEADLFFLPILTKPKGGQDWNKACHNATVEKVLRELHHLTPTTACKHFFVISKGHYVGRNCTGWFKNPVPQLNNTMRLAYSHIPAGANRSQPPFSPSELSQNRLEYPNLFSVPYASSLHWNASTTSTPPWAKFDERRHLMRFFGGANHGDQEVRTRIVQACESYQNDLICPSDFKFSLDKLQEKGKSIFCLEPAGDSPWRKSLADSISFGCIPVFFSELTDETSPFSWGAWKPQARVLIPRKDFVEGRVDLYHLLSSIPPQLLELMQDTLGRYAKQFQYSLDEDEDDGIRVTLEGLHRHASEMQRQGICK
jgi:hypothetical protein